MIRRRPIPTLLILLAGATCVGSVASVALAPARAEAQDAASRLPPDLTLHGAAERALRLDPWLAAARAGAEGARERVDGARASLFPSLSATASGVRFGEPMVVAPLHGFDPTSPPDFDRTLLQGSLDLSWTVWDGGGQGARIDQARAEWTGSLAETDAARQDRLVALVDRYLAVLTTRDVVEARTRREEALLAERQRVEDFLAEGTAPRVELLRVEAELSSVRADAASSRADLIAAEAALARALGVEPESLASTTLSDPSLAGPAEEDGIARRAADAASTHPAVAAARARATAAGAAAAEARSSRLPTVHATGALQEFGGADSDFLTEWQTGLRISYPLFTGGARSAADDAAEARVRQADAGVEQARRAVAEAEDRALARLQDARSRSAALEDAVERFLELARVEALALAEGAGVQSDLLRAQAGLAEARAGLAGARRDVVRSRVALARARGVLTLSWLDTHLVSDPGSGEELP